MFSTVRAIVILTLIMLIATRLTWLQTSQISPSVSSSVYRTGVRFAETLKARCAAKPDATFPLPASVAYKASFEPPTLTSGFESLGLLGSFVLYCQFVQLDAEGLAALNPWILGATSLLLALVVRLLTSSWTAGLFCAVAILSRGTLQSRATLVSEAFYGQLSLALTLAFGAMYLRTLALPWYLLAFMASLILALFVPSFFIFCILLAILPLWLFGSRRAGILTKSELHALPLKIPTLPQFALSLMGSLLIGGLATLIDRTEPFQSLGFMRNPLSFITSENTQPLLHAKSSFVATIGNLFFGGDFHRQWSVVSLAYFFLFPHNHHSFVRAFMLFFATLLGCATIGSSWLGASWLSPDLDFYLRQTTLMIIEPAIIGLGIAPVWMVINHLTGGKLSRGWSIRSALNFDRYR